MTWQEAYKRGTARLQQCGVKEAGADAKKILMDNGSLLDEISEYLLVKETITGDELMAYVNADKNKLPEAENTEE